MDRLISSMFLFLAGLLTASVIAFIVICIACHPHCSRCGSKKMIYQNYKGLYVCEDCAREIIRIEMEGR